MKKSLFLKQFIVHMSILILSFVILGSIFITTFETYFVNQKENQLQMQGEKIAKQYALMYYTGAVNIGRLTLELRILEEHLNARTIVIDNKRHISLVSQGIDENWIGEVVSQGEIERVLQGEMVTIKNSSFGGIFSEPVLTVGYPIEIGAEILGAIFMNASIPEIQKSISEVYVIILTSLAISVTIAFPLIWFSIKRISDPLRAMNQVAKIIANGDFEKRITIKSADEVGQLAKSFNEMAKSLSEQEKLKNNFISNISHDLRSPLTSIQGFLEAIIDGTIPKEDREHYLHVVLDETKRITKLSNDILDINAIEYNASNLQKTNFDINELLRNTLVQFENRVNEKQLKLELLLAQQITIINADQERVRRVFYNLIDNAIKFTNKKGRIIIETILKNNKIYVSVKDYGMGISDEELKHIFDRFYKADQSRGIDKQGSGLGLSIVKEFIKAHGETIEVISQEGIGSEFIVSFTVVVPELG